LVPAVPRYYFDIRENNEIAVDEQGLELPDLKSAEVEAAHSLGDMAKNMPDGVDGHHMAIEVRTDVGPIFTATFIFQLTRH
jgi:hypothetical protein